MSEASRQESGIGILPMSNGRHGQDARATWRTKR